jgi:hypothetical protein
VVVKCGIETMKEVYMAISTQARQPQKGLTFEDVWAMFQESKAEHDRMIAEAERRFQETDRKFQETDRMVKETTQAVKEMSARVDRVTKNVGGLNRSVGELIETLIAARLWEKFAAYPYRLQRAYQRVPIYDEWNKARTDIDVLLADTEWAMAVEVKREADNEDVDHHLKRMELIRRYPPREIVGKRLLGTIAGGVIPPDTVEYAHRAGFFALELAGESVVLLDTPAGFTAKEW